MNKLDDVPEFPCVKTWYRVAITDDAVIFQHGERALCFQGKAASKLLPVLLPILDGTRTVEQVIEYMGKSIEPATANALRLLAERGVLTSGAPVGASAPRPVRESARFHAAYRDDEPESLAQQRLSDASVAVVGAGVLADEIARQVSLSGVTAVQRRPFDAGAGDLASADLVVVVPDRGELDWMAHWNAEALRRRIPWMQVLAYDSRFSAVGPLYLPHATCCYECYRLRLASNVAYRGHYWALERSTPSSPLPSAMLAIVSGLAALLVARWIVARDPLLPGRFYAVNPGPTVRSDTHMAYRVPRCSACSAAVAASAPSPWYTLQAGTEP
ncbi:TOMM precursor leader peptide-binding protein [Sorangium sp. So ce204]|uniref:TOMM precursor leader peptide-binding protein n=1 Tax=Sorangium sp. So ce204 TaxID=3133288 RepID=UPI003F613A4C